ncbi:MAG: putative transposase [Cellvibrionaceae bacterium]
MRPIFPRIFWYFIDLLQIKYLNTFVEQDHQCIRKITQPMLGFKSFHSASAALTGIEVAHMIRKGQLIDNLLPAHEQFMAIAG